MADIVSPSLPEHRKGFVLTLLGVLALCPDTLLVRLIDTDPWTLMFWRGLLLGTGLLVLYAAAEGPGWLTSARRLGRWGLLVALLFSGSSITFIYALEHTSVANTLLIVATAPLWAALLSWIFLHERIALRTWGAILLSAGGIAVIFIGSLGGGTLVGDLAALLTAFGIAGELVVIRRHRHVNMVPTLAFGGLIAALVSLPLAAPLSLSPHSFGLTLIMGLLLLPVALGLIALGPRYMPAPEVSLLMLLETVLGPLIVWWALGETASPAALLGGAIVVLTLAGHAALGLRAGAAGRD